MNRFTKEQLNQIIDSGEPILVVRATDPKAFGIASIIKNTFVLAREYEQAAYARQAEIDILEYRRVLKLNERQTNDTPGN